MRCAPETKGMSPTSLRMHAIWICILTITVATILEAVRNPHCAPSEECMDSQVSNGSKYRGKFKEACIFHSVCLCCGLRYDWNKMECDREFLKAMRKECKNNTKCKKVAKTNYEHAKKRNHMSRHPPRSCNEPHAEDSLKKD